MTRPLTFLWRMVAFLAAVALVTLLLGAELAGAFASNPLLNGLIGAVLLLGIAWNIRQVLLLTPEVAWLEAFQKPRAGAPAALAPRLLAPMASMFSTRRSERVSLSAPVMRGVLDGIASRLDESREISRYATNLLIFLGLLGTFWGLILTIGAVANVIGEMNVGGGGDVNAMFNQLKAGLAQPLAGMGIAFSSSMLGLAGALVLGFLDLTAGQAQNRFFNELEEWLAGLTRISGGAQGAEGEGAIPAYMQALLEETTINLDILQASMARAEEGRAANAEALAMLAGRMSALTDQMQRLAERDEAAQHLLRIEQLLSRLLDDTIQGRAHATAELRGEIKLLGRSLDNRPG